MRQYLCCNYFTNHTEITNVTIVDWGAYGVGDIDE